MKIVEDQIALVPGYPLNEIDPDGRPLFFDIETTGLRKETSQVYLIGCGFFEGENNFHILQWLAQSALDERDVIDAFFTFAGDYSTLVQFNGEHFDVPYLAYKADLYGFDFDFSAFRSVDLYQEAKRAKKLLRLPHLRQKSVEEFLKAERTDEMNGGQLISYYYNYERTGDSYCEDLLLLHNHDDIRGMGEILAVAAYPDLLSGRFSFRGYEECGGTAILEYTLDHPVPRAVEVGTDDLLLAADGDLLQINVRLYEGEVKVAVPDVENYYYLPTEDMIVHKDVAQFIDSEHRRKATRKNCFLKKQGKFLPSYGMIQKPDLVVFDEKGIPSHFIDTEDLLGSRGIRPEHYAMDILNVLC